MALLDDLKTFFDASSISGGATGWSTVLSFMPDNPDKVIYCRLVGSLRPPEPDFYYPDVHIVVRGESFDPQAAITKANAVITALDGGNISSSYTYSFADNNIIDIGRDANNRSMLSINFRVMEEK